MISSRKNIYLGFGVICTLGFLVAGYYIYESQKDKYSQGLNISAYEARIDELLAMQAESRNRISALEAEVNSLTSLPNAEPNDTTQIEPQFQAQNGTCQPHIDSHLKVNLHFGTRQP